MEETLMAELKKPLVTNQKDECVGDSKGMEKEETKEREGEHLDPSELKELLNKTPAPPNHFLEGQNYAKTQRGYSKKGKRKISLNLSVNNKNQLIIPNKNPCNNKVLQYITESGTPLVPMIKQLQKTIDHLPVSQDSLWKQSCSGDKVTNASWNKKWNDALSQNEKNYDFKKLSCFKFFGSQAYKPVVIAGAGPSLKNNFKYLLPSYFDQKNLATGKEEESLMGGREDIKIVSCLHNFAFFEDNNIMTDGDYYVNLDAGPITVTELSESGDHDEKWYWKKTKDRVLIATVLSNPELLNKWQGEIWFFKTGSSVVNNYSKRVDPTIVPTFSVGGNVLGACLYFSKAILGAGDIIFIGADFCFSYDHKFHSWNSEYDNQFRGVMPATDIYGNRVFTWPSYYNFKCFFEFISMGGLGHNPQNFYNATEGGIFGAYPEGNIRSVCNIPLKEVLHSFNMYKRLPNLMKQSKQHELVLF